MPGRITEQEKDMAKKEGIPAGMIVLATVVGGILGAAAGLLLAPQSGEITREKIRETYGTAVRNIGNVASKVDEKVASIAERVVSEVKELPEQVRSEAGKIVKEAENTFNRTLEKGSSYVNELTGSVATTLQEGKKKFLEKKDLFTIK